MHRKLKALDWTLAIAVGDVYAAGLTVVAVFGESHDTLAAATMLIMWIVGFLFVIFEGASVINCCCSKLPSFVKSILTNSKPKL